MTYQDDFTLSAALLEQGSLEQLSTQGLGALPDLFPVLLNAVMQIERQQHLGAAPHERTEERTGHANGYKDKTLNTRLGQITVAVPQVREVNGQGGGFYNREIKRRTQVASIFPNEASCLRLVSALLMETSDDWQAGKAYLTFSQ